MPLLFSLADTRDVIVIVYGIIGIILFLVAIFVILFLFLSLKGLLRAAREIVDDNVRPAVSSIRDAAEMVRGTTEFFGRTAASPIVRAYGVIAGVRKGMGVLSGLNRRRGRD